MKNFVTILYGLLFSITIYSQSIDDYIKQNAIELKNINKLNDSVYKHFAKYKIIMLGEIHGTNETAQLANSLAHLFTKHNDTVCLGIEIKPEELTKFIANPTLQNLQYSKYFLSEDIDGRRSITWFNVIKHQLKNKKVKLFFFDFDNDNITTNRDSMLYENVKTVMENNPHSKTILLTGNLHNRLVCANAKKRMGYYLATDSSLKLANKICSINTSFDTATMLNKNVGEEKRLKQMIAPKSELSTAVNYKQYLLFLGEGIDYNAYFFVRNLTASKSYK